MLCDHEFHRVHHYGYDRPPELVHYCPTGFDECYHCGEWRHTPEGEEVCAKWAEA